MKTNLFKNLAILLLLAGMFYTCTAEKTDDNTQNEECLCHLIDCDFDLSELNEENCLPELGWVVGLTPKSEITDSLTENTEIKALIAEHGVTFYLSWEIYILQGKDCNMCRARAAVRAFLATGLFEHVRIFGITTIR